MILEMVIVITGLIIGMTVSMLFLMHKGGMRLTKN